MCAKGGDFKKGALDSDSCLSTLNLINQRNVSHIKLSKYCDIDARLDGYSGNVQMKGVLQSYLQALSNELSQSKIR